VMLFFSGNGLVLTYSLTPFCITDTLKPLKCSSLNKNPWWLSTVCHCLWVPGTQTSLGSAVQLTQRTPWWPLLSLSHEDLLLHTLVCIIRSPLSLPIPDFPPQTVKALSVSF
jgi:hypothetical protein